MIPYIFLLEILAMSLGSPNWLLVHEEGRIERVEGRLDLDDEALDTLDHLWHWSQVSAPRRLEAVDLESFEPPADGDHLLVRVAAPEDHPARSGTLVAAPEAMWSRIPEAYLPAWPVPKDAVLRLPRQRASWRIRLHSECCGSWWATATAGASRVAVVPSPADELRFEILGSEGQPVDSATMQLSESAFGRGAGGRFLAHFRAEDGELSIPGLPDGGRVSVLVTARGHVPRWLEGQPSALPRRIQLARGSVLRGRFVSRRGEGIEGADVRLEALIGSGFLVREEKSGPEGDFEITGLPAGRAVVEATARGFGTMRLELELEAEGLDLGDLVLEPAGSLRMTVLDEAGEPIAGAELRARPGGVLTTDAEGVAELEQVAPANALEVQADALGFRRQVLAWKPPLPEAALIRLDRMFLVRGRFLDSDGSVPERGRAVARAGSSEIRQALGRQGGFELELEPEHAAELILSSPETRELRLALVAGRAGEVRELGDLLAPEGHRLSGRLSSEIDGRPVAGARVFMPRPSAGHPAEAWFSGDLLATTSDAEGRFVLRGLRRQPGQLTIEAAGFARRQLAFSPRPGDPDTDLGDIELSAGVDLEVVLEGASWRDAIARVDLGNRWLEMDMLTAPFAAGRATFRHLPAGQVTVTALRGDELLCEENLSIPSGEYDVELVCRAAALRVSGRVELAGYPSGPGRLAWLPPALESPGFIDKSVSARGLEASRIVGGGRPQVDVEVAADGYFTTDELRPGSWQVLWQSAAGGASPARSLELPAVDEIELVLDFPGAAVIGDVVDRDERPVEGARVRDLGTGQTAFTGAGGDFRLVGLEPGTRWIRAEAEGLSSGPLEVDVEAERTSGPVRLVVAAEDSRPELEVQVLSTSGGVAGAFVFLETSPASGLRILSTDAGGWVRLGLDPPFPQRLRLAASTAAGWAFGPWRTWQDVQAEPVRLELVATGSLSLVATCPVPDLSLVSASGWEISWLRRRLGRPASLDPDRPLEIPGLPEGSYRLSANGKAHQVRIEADRTTELELELPGC